MLADTVPDVPFTPHRFLFDGAAYDYIQEVFDGATTGEAFAALPWARQPFDPMYVEIDHPNGQIMGCYMDNGLWHFLLKSPTTEATLLAAFYRFDTGGFSSVKDIDRVGITAMSGIMATFICAMLMLNQPSVHEIVRVEASRGMVRGKVVPYRAHNTVALKLGTKPRTIKDWLTGERGSPRRHEVRGHWVNFRKTTGCEHEFTELEPFDNTRHECCKCGQRRSWKPHFERGDAGKGFVTKDYRVTP